MEKLFHVTTVPAQNVPAPVTPFAGVIKKI